MSGNTPRPGGQRRPATKTGAAKKATRPGGRKDKTPLTRKEQFRRWLRYALIAGVVGTVLMCAIFYFAYRATEIPDPNEAFQAQTTKVYYSGGKTELGSFAVQNRESIPLADIPKTMQDAVVAAEDRSFWTNKGIDPKGILRAAFSNAKGGATQGASTITQQYVKILYLSQERTFKRKIKEAFLSLKIQQQQSKSQILEGYLNTIYFGRGAYGVQAASYAYFNKPAKKLTAAESAMLAAVLNSPNYLSTNPDALLSRYRYVVNGMVEAGDLDAGQGAEIAQKLPDTAKQRTSNTYGGQKGFMLDMVKKELIKLGFDEAQIDSGGLRVTTTFNRKVMDAAKAAVEEVRPDGVKGLHAAVASVDVKTGALLGFFGGQDYLQSQLNWATTPLPPGSAFKPFAVAAGIKDGFALKDTFDGNSPYEFPDGSKVVNEGEGTGEDFGSRISLTTATQKSVNTAFIDLTESMDGGPRKIASMAEAMGVPTLPDDMVNARISLGGAPVSPANMANAYGAIANGGQHHDLYTIAKVTRASDGEVLYNAPKKLNRVLDEDIAADTSYALQKVVDGGTGGYARNLGRPAAGKTGTATNDDKHVITSWFVGYTPQVATAVAYSRGTGYKPIDDGYLPRGYFGATYPTETWTAAMERIMDGLPEEDFPKPANVDGEAPDNGHAPVPTRKPKPTNKPKPTTSSTPTPTSNPTPTAPGEPTQNGVCSAFPDDPDCQSTPTPTPTPTSTEPCSGILCPGNGNGGGNGRRTYEYSLDPARQGSSG